MNKKILSLSLILIILLTFLTGCIQNRGIENLAYVVAIGIDKGSNNILKLTFQFASQSR